MEVYLFEKEKTRAFRMERRKHYQQNKKVVEEILKIGKDRQVKAGYRGDVHLPEALHNSVWQNAGKGLELTCVTWLYCEEFGNERDYLFVGEFGTPSTILAPLFEVEKGSYVNNGLETLVKEVKKGLQAYTLYGTTTKPWFYTFEDKHITPAATIEEENQAAAGLAKELRENPDLLRALGGTEEEIQKWLQQEIPPQESHDHILRGLTVEERQEFIRIYNS
jgi:hypothetical protein